MENILAGTVSSEGLSGFMTPEAVAACLGVKKNTLYHWLRKGLIKHHRMSRTIRIHQSDLLAFVKGCERKGYSLGSADQEMRETTVGNDVV